MYIIWPIFLLVVFRLGCRIDFVVFPKNIKSESSTRTFKDHKSFHMTFIRFNFDFYVFEKIIIFDLFLVHQQWLYPMKVSQFFSTFLIFWIWYHFHLAFPAQDLSSGHSLRDRQIKKLYYNNQKCFVLKLELNLCEFRTVEDLILLEFFEFDHLHD